MHLVLWFSRISLDSVYPLVWVTEPVTHKRTQPRSAHEMRMSPCNAGSQLVGNTSVSIPVCIYILLDINACPHIQARPCTNTHMCTHTQATWWWHIGIFMMLKKSGQSTHPVCHICQWQHAWGMGSALHLRMSFGWPVWGDKLRLTDDPSQPVHLINKSLSSNQVLSSIQVCGRLAYFSSRLKQVSLCFLWCIKG